MNGFEGNKTSKPKWTTDFKDEQINKEENGTSWTKEGYAGWDINVTSTYKDSGDKVGESIKPGNVHLLFPENILQLPAGVLCKSNRSRI